MSSAKAAIIDRNSFSKSYGCCMSPSHIIRKLSNHKIYDCLWVYFGDVPNAFTDSTKTSRSPSSTLSFSTKSATRRAAPYLTVLTESEQNLRRIGMTYSKIICGLYIWRIWPNWCPIHSLIRHFFWSIWNYSNTPTNAYLLL